MGRRPTRAPQGITPPSEGVSAHPLASDARACRRLSKSSRGLLGIPQPPKGWSLLPRHHRHPSMHAYNPLQLLRAQTGAQTLPGLPVTAVPAELELATYLPGPLSHLCNLLAHLRFLPWTLLPQNNCIQITGPQIPCRGTQVVCTAAQPSRWTSSSRVQGPVKFTSFSSTRQSVRMHARRREPDFPCPRPAAPL